MEIYYNTYCNSLSTPPTTDDTVAVTVKATSEPPTWAELLEFVENQRSILESVEEAKGSNTSKS